MEEKFPLVLVPFRRTFTVLAWSPKYHDPV